MWPGYEVNAKKKKKKKKKKSLGNGTGDCGCVVTEFIPEAYMQLCALALHAKLKKKKNNTVTFDELMLKALIFVLFWTLRPQFVSQVPVA